VPLTARLVTNLVVASVTRASRVTTAQRMGFVNNAIRGVYLAAMEMVDSATPANPAMSRMKTENATHVLSRTVPSAP